jgi:peptidyl-prolyl cis-trans isomerase-like protein 2
VTKEPLEPKDLIKLNYSRKASGEYHDPISFKPFSEHSHIVAIATTGNVYLAGSIKGGKDLLDDVKFKKYAHAHIPHASSAEKPQGGCHYVAESAWNAISICSVNVNISEDRNSTGQRKTNSQTKTHCCEHR